MNRERRCTCISGRDADGAEYGACEYCEQADHDERWGNRDMLNELHANPQTPPINIRETDNA